LVRTSSVATFARVRDFEVGFLSFYLASSVYCASLTVPMLAYLCTHLLIQQELLALSDIEGLQADLLIEHAVAVLLITVPVVGLELFSLAHLSINLVLEHHGPAVLSTTFYWTAYPVS
jgi:hypothetical protein